MLIPLPIGAEVTLRRLPWVVIGLIVANCLVFAFTATLDTGPVAEEEARLERLAEWSLTKVARRQPDLGEIVKRYPSAIAFLQQEEALLGQVADDQERGRLSAYLGEYRSLTAHHPFYRFGFVPASITLPRIILHMFFHADFLHLFFNMLFLWIVGGMLEDTLGRVLFSLVYIMSGIAAALAHAASQPASVEPAIGASGAVSGLIGVLMIVHARTPVRIALVYALGLVPRVRVFSVPAAAFLGFWLLEQVFWATMMAHVYLGVAVWAHLGGFAFGALAGLVAKSMLPARVPAGETCP